MFSCWWCLGQYFDLLPIVYATLQYTVRSYSTLKFIQHYSWFGWGIQYKNSFSVPPFKQNHLFCGPRTFLRVYFKSLCFYVGWSELVLGWWGSGGSVEGCLIPIGVSSSSSTYEAGWVDQIFNNLTPNSVPLCVVNFCLIKIRIILLLLETYAIPFTESST